MYKITHKNSKKLNLCALRFNQFIADITRCATKSALAVNLESEYFLMSKTHLQTVKPICFPMMLVHEEIIVCWPFLIQMHI